MIENPRMRDLDDRTGGGGASADRKRGLVDTSGSVPLIEGTTIEAHRIAALVDDMTVEEILEDYPSLDERHVRAAREYAEANPDPHGAYPRITAKRAMRSARADVSVPPRE